MKQSGKTIREYNQPDDDSLRGRNYLFVTGDSTPAKNAKELKDTYELAKLIKPNKLARSATNRITIVVAPGIYTFGTAKFAMMLAYIDVVSLTGNRDVLLDGISVMANGVFIRGIDCGTNEFYFSGTFPNTLVENCKGLNYEVGSGMSSVYVDESMQGDGKVDTPNGVKVSAEQGNQLIQKDDGLFVPVTISILISKSGLNGLIMPKNIPAYSTDKTITSVQLASNCAGIDIIINSIHYDAITLVGVTVVAGDEIIINDMTIKAGEENADALITL